ncbi:hypothetical protein KEM55_002768 [Ascosphaera atra]|nr:hypothetical protein KEM55_002768 [Ascosphaera atra]
MPAAQPAQSTTSIIIASIASVEVMGGCLGIFFPQVEKRAARRLLIWVGWPGLFTIMYYDLNVPYTPDVGDISDTLTFLAELGYTTVALSQSVSGKLPATLAPPAFPQHVPKSLNLLSRLTLSFSESSQNQRLVSLANAYDIVALRPTNEKCLLLACTSLDCDIISLDLSVRLPFHFKFKTVASAIARGIRFEICYSPGITGSGYEARRNLIGNAASLIRATRGRGIIVSSEAKRALGVRAPWDVVNLACVWGLSQGRAKEAICEESRKVVAFARMKRTSWRGIVDVVYGGEKPAPADKDKEKGKDKQGSRGQDKKQSASAGEQAAGADAAQGEKRKAVTDSPQSVELAAPLSKREQKRRAKKARLEAAAADPGKES